MIFGFFGKSGDDETEESSGCECDGRVQQSGEIHRSKPTAIQGSAADGQSSTREFISSNHNSRTRTTQRRRAELGGKYVKFIGPANTVIFDSNANLAYPAVGNSSHYDHQTTTNRCQVDENVGASRAIDLISSEDVVILVPNRYPNVAGYFRSITVWKGTLSFELLRVGNGHAPHTKESPRASRIFADKPEPVECELRRKKAFCGENKVKKIVRGCCFVLFWKAFCVIVYFRQNFMCYKNNNDVVGSIKVFYYLNRKCIWGVNSFIFPHLFLFPV